MYSRTKNGNKDYFPLPHIDILVDNKAEHSLLSFMDYFSGYNQIKMNPEDMRKTYLFRSGEYFATVSCLLSLKKPG